MGPFDPPHLHPLAGPGHHRIRPPGRRHLRSTRARRGAMLVAAFLTTAAGATAPAAAPLQRIAFGSCNKHDAEQPMWDAIVAAAPDLWIWSGDIVYADTQDMDLLRDLYTVQRLQPGYRRLLATCPVIGTWDDHDYGLNDGGREYPQRAGSQQELLDFLALPPDAPRRQRAGVYARYVYGPAGRRVKVLLLDTRYHREAPGDTSDVLGAQQWQWLEDQLTGSDASLHLIVSSIQVIAEEHEYEKWANFPRARRRLFDLLRRSGAPGVIFISGDRHIAEISHLDADVAGYPLYDITSSGLTHSWTRFSGEPNRHRLGEVFHDLNYGLIEIDWAADPVMLELQIRDRANQVRLRQSVPLSLLTPRP